MKTAISIPSYNYRYTKLIEGLNNDKELRNKYDVFVFLSNDDLNIDKYNIYNNLSLIRTNYQTLMEKKQYIFDYLYNKGYEKTFLIDDDITYLSKKLIEGYMLESGKGYKGISTSFLDLCDECNKKMDELNISFLTTIRSFALGFHYPGEIMINKTCNLGQFGLFNIKRIIESGIKFTQNPYEHEDVDMIFQIRLKGLGIGALLYYTFFIDQKSVDNSSFNKDIESLMHINLYIKYRDGITLRVDKNDKLRIIVRYNSYSDYEHIPIKNDKYHNQLYELCKETIETKDFDKLKNFIKNR